jgi:hypothetical protein
MNVLKRLGALIVAAFVLFYAIPMFLLLYLMHGLDRANDYMDSLIVLFNK